MMPPIQNPPQAYEYSEYIRRIKHLTPEASKDILDIEANASLLEMSPKLLQSLKTSLYNIECKTSAAFSSLYTWKTSHTKPTAGANKEHATAVKTKHTTSARYLEPSQDRDTKGINTGDKTIDNITNKLPNNMARNRTTISKLQDTKHTMCHIEAILKEAETSQDIPQQREHTDRIKTLMSEVKISLLTLESAQGKTQELSILWTSLV